MTSPTSWLPKFSRFLKRTIVVSSVQRSGQKYDRKLYLHLVDTDGDCQTLIRDAQGCERPMRMTHAR